ncbi:hypothetical protein WICPIJ_010152 [Wickerhamomyces pijperi]|uniref:DNA mismatch repair protein HSM3 n=1 Tax=Wickerhamomyces pijperi TaxID=599730 RepID=A0A9P8TA69_WICPI|nr:hypothetical protein WICPIJ_010152 [Wickerhamomyces pijperi]
MTSKVISLISQLLKAINETPLDDLDSLIDEIISLITLDHSLFQNTEEQEYFNHLFLTVVAILKQSGALDEDETTLEYDKITELLDVMISISTYEQILNLISFDTLLQALDSQIPELQVLAMKILSKASPPDILANTPVINKLIFLLVNVSNVRVTNEIEISLDVLLRGELIIRRLLSQENLQVIDDAFQSAEGNNAVIVSRMLNLVLLLLEHTKTRDEIEDSVTPLLNKLIPTTAEDMDEMQLINLLQFYVDALSLIDGSLTDKAWLLDMFKPYIVSLISVYKSDLDKFDFIEGSIAELYSKISMVSLEFLSQLDSQFIHIGKAPTSLLLSSISPAYLSAHHPTLLSKLRITLNAIPVYRNLIRDNACFQLIKPSLNSKDILKQSYLEYIAIVESLSRYQPVFLLTELPQVMTKLLDGEAVTEEECFELRKRTLMNLNGLSDERLNVWKGKVQHEWNLLVNGAGRNIAEVAVFDSSM